MKVPSRVSHEGKVIEISKDTISVEIVNKSACAACHAKGVCAASDEAIKVIEVPYTITTLVQEFEVGETVNVLLDSSLGLSAVVLAYVVPLALLMALIFILYSCSLSEPVIALGAVGGVALYYFVLFLFRNRLSRVFTFSIEKIDK